MDTQMAAYKATSEASESVADEELEGISLEEALVKVDHISAEIKELEMLKKKIITNPTMTDISKKLRCKPMNIKIKEHKRDINKYEKVRALHLGVLDKLPKGTPLYDFAFNCQYARKMQNIATKKIEEEKNQINSFLNEEY